MIKTKILGTGKYLPKKVLTNKDLEKMVDTSDEWITERTGIKERRIANKEGGEWPTDMALHASKEAIKNAGIQANDIDMILFASLSPDVKLPNSACILQQKLEMTNGCAALDIAAACSGFVYGINMGNAMIKTGLMKTILVVGSEILSRETNWKDRDTCILFGDGCGAAILGITPEGEQSDIISSTLGADGSGREFFEQNKGGSVSPITKEILENNEQFMTMKGREMFKVATRTLTDNAKKVLAMANLENKDVDWLVPHQANIRIIETTRKFLRLEPEKVVINIQKYGNTSAATVPIAFHEAIEDGRIKRGQLVMFDVFGAGLTSGATLIRY